MKNKKYDFVFITNCPSFYKINLFNELNKYCQVYALFLGYSDRVVINQDFEKECDFDFHIINKSSIENRNVFITFIKLQKIIRKLKFEKIVYGGYSILELVLTFFLYPKNKNILQTESAQETVLSGWRFFLKKRLVKRFSKALVSGKIHSDMLRKMGFEAEIIITNGVGFLNKNDENQFFEKKSSKNELKYLYVGRLITLKNVEFLIDVFNENGKHLTIVGKGIEEEKLKQKAKDNIHFLGFIDNKELGYIYSNHDVFVLPSLSEPWGLVVEEALYYNCALLLSDNIGSKTELLETPKTGVTFDPTSTKSLSEAIDKLETNFDFYMVNAEKFDIDEKDKIQLKAYLDLVKK